MSVFARVRNSAMSVKRAVNILDYDELINSGETTNKQSLGLEDEGLISSKGSGRKKRKLK